MLSLEQLSSRWLLPDDEADFSLPAITNFRGSVQAAWGITGVQNWLTPPTGLRGATAELYHEHQGRLRRFPSNVLYQWRAYELLRRGHGVESATRLCARGPGLLQRLRFERPGRYYLVFGGVPRDAGAHADALAWDGPQANASRVDDGFELGDASSHARARFSVPGSHEIYRDLAGFLSGEAPVERGGLGVASFDVEAGEELSWCATQGAEAELEPASDWGSAQREWEQVWEDAFRASGPHFEGRLPEREGPLERLYLMSVLSLLQCRRLLPHRRGADDPGKLERAYVWGGPERAPTSLFTWDLEFQAPLLARLDPGVLRAQLDAMLALDPEQQRGLEIASGAGLDPGHAAHAPALLGAVADYVRVTGDHAWAQERLPRLEALANEHFSDFGGHERCSECVPSWEHGVVAFNAAMVRGLRFLAELSGERRWSRAAKHIARAVLDHFADGPFACSQPDGERRVVRTLLDLVYAGHCMSDDLPPFVRRRMLDFARAELMSHDWLRALSESDADARAPALPALQRERADHQVSGCSPAWAGRFAAVLLRFDEHELAHSWMRRAQELTREGPFGQAYRLHPDGARKASFLSGSCAWSASGAAFATTLLEEL